MSASASTCSHCGKKSKKGMAFKRCSVCKEAEYCGAECQKAGWKQHKPMCAPPLSPQEVWAAMKVASAAADWRGVLKWEGRMEELLAGRLDAFSEFVLIRFSDAHKLAWNDTGSNEHFNSAVRLQDRLIDLLGKLERFRDQGNEMCVCAQFHNLTHKNQEAARYYQRARDVGAAHGFFSVESQACVGLGLQASTEGRHEEGLDLLRNALAAASLSEDDPCMYEVTAFSALSEVLFQTNSYDELEELVPGYRVSAKAESVRLTHPSLAEMECLLASARVHEARGRPQDAAREVRAMFDLIHDIERRRAANQNLPGLLAEACHTMLQSFWEHLSILRRATGDEELIKAFDAELAKLHRLV